MLEAANPQDLLVMYQGPGNAHPDELNEPGTGQAIAPLPSQGQAGDSQQQKLVWYSIWDIHD